MRRVVWAIARRSFAKGTRLKTQMSKATMGVCIFFIFCFVLNVISFVFPQDLSYTSALDSSESDGKVLFVNSPDSFESFLLQKYAVHPEFVESAFLREKSGAYYDFLTYQQKISQDEAVLVIVFPTDFDEQIDSLSSETRPEILTYYNPSDENSSYAHDTFANELLTQYADALQTAHGRITAVTSVFTVLQQEISVAQTDTGRWGGSRVFTHMFLPLILFIAIMYACMEAGMASVAGEKERGTFAAILLTPARRIEIVLGNALGILLHAMLPASIMIFLFTAVFGYFQVGILLYLIILCLSLSLLMTALVLIISILNRSILAAQASFLPIFFILLIVCITAMQNESTPGLISYLIPFYGHYYGIAAALDGTYSIATLSGLCGGCAVLTVGLLLAADRLLHIERFTTGFDDNQDMQKERRRRDKDLIVFQKAAASPQNVVYDYHPQKSRPALKVLMNNFLLPLYVLAVFQTLALIVPFLLYLRSDAATAFFTGLSQSGGRLSIPVDMVMRLLASLMQTKAFVFTMGVSYVLVIAVYVLIIRVFEKQPMSSVGLTLRGPAARKKALFSYIRGLLIGFGMMLGVFLILLITGQARVSGFGLDASSSGLFFVYILMWIPQGAAEELMFRGHMLPRLSIRFGRSAAVLLTSLSFGLLHSGNAGFSVIPFLNLILISIFFALLSLSTQEIWTVCAAHSIWNFAQGNLFGLEVSGTQSAARLIQTNYTETSYSFLTGGNFGPEGGLIVTGVIVLCLLILFFIRNKLNKAILGGSKENTHVRRDF